MDEKEKVAIVTGGGAGIGQALCVALARRGMNVVVADLDGEKAEETVRQIQQVRGRASSATVDVAIEEGVRGLVDRTVSEHGRLDVMINNAGIGIGGDVRDLSLDHWQQVFAVNWWGVLHGTRAAYAQMTRQGFGHIVNVASMSGLLPHPFNAPYSASKHAVVGLSLALRHEADVHGVRVSVVCPGYVETDIFRTAKMINVDDEKRQGLPRR
jgi:NAD(P)-dependent dehydrogenase (short-subunit alcohol dehydrogenase family)